MKTNLYIQFSGKQVDEKELVRIAKEQWRDAGHKMKDILTLDIYVKPEEHKAYYAINECERGEIIL